MGSHIRGSTFQILLGGSGVSVEVQNVQGLPV